MSYKDTYKEVFWIAKGWGLIIGKPLVDDPTINNLLRTEPDGLYAA